MIDTSGLTTIEMVNNAIVRAESCKVLLSYKAMRLRQKIEKANELAESLSLQYETVILKLNRAIQSATIEEDGPGKIYWHNEVTKLEDKKAKLEYKMEDCSLCTIHDLFAEKGEYDLGIAYWEQYISKLEVRKSELVSEGSGKSS